MIAPHLEQCSLSISYSLLLWFFLFHFLDLGVDFRMVFLLDWTAKVGSTDRANNWLRGAVSHFLKPGNLMSPFLKRP